MKIFIRITIICIAALTIISCEKKVKMVAHDEMMAIETANTFIRHLMAGSYEEAYMMFTADYKEFRPIDSFRASVEDNIGVLGNWRTVTFDYYMLVGAEPTIELLYMADFDVMINIPLHFILEGTMSRGYSMKVIDFGHSYKPFGENDNRPHLRIDKAVVVRK
ncbi:MAG: hypothetical protein JSV21_01085 [Nitrospirota bacterium]|nr:MAG: hypothetical protein JSV21_01085 [Nitrospirota bacterium]